MSAARVQAGSPHPAYGLHKIIVAVTRSGVMYGLHSKDGQKLWSTLLPHPEWRHAALAPLHQPPNTSEKLQARPSTHPSTPLPLAHALCTQHPRTSTRPLPSEHMPQTRHACNAARTRACAKGRRRACVQGMRSGRSTRMHAGHVVREGVVQVMVVRVSDTRSEAYMLDALSGRVVKVHSLPGALTHIDDVGAGPETGSIFLIASVLPPYQRAMPVQILPPGAEELLTEDLIFWASNASSGTHRQHAELLYGFPRCTRS
jgi:hypothetical protein